MYLKGGLLRLEDTNLILAQAGEAKATLRIPVLTLSGDVIRKMSLVFESLPPRPQDAFQPQCPFLNPF